MDDVSELDVSRALIVGDVHGNLWAWERTILPAFRKSKAEVILQVGDFGYGWNVDFDTDVDVYLETLDEMLEDECAEILWLDGNHECVPIAARAVTPTGLATVDQLKVGDLVLSVNEDGTRSWQPILELIRRKHVGDMIAFRSRGVHLDVTPGHRMVHRSRSERAPFSVERAGEWHHSLRQFVVAATNKGDDSVALSDDEIRLAAWCLTDSWTNGDAWRFSQRSSKAWRIRELLERLSLPFTESSRQRDITEIDGKPVRSTEPEVTFRIPVEASRKLAFEHGTLMPELWNLSERQVDIFVEEYVYCDGSIPTNSTTARVIYCSDRSKRESLMALFVANGWRTSATEYRPRHWRINLAKTTTLWFGPIGGGTVETIPADGEVWCVRVPNGRWIVENENRFLLTGNCFDRLEAKGHFPNKTTVQQTSERTWYLPRGYVWEWNSIRCMALGGAYSVDKEYREPGVSWWPQEELTDEDVKRACAQGAVDVLFAHDAILEVQVPGLPGPDEHDPWRELCGHNRSRVSKVAQATGAELFLHGHLHVAYNDYDGLAPEVVGLNCESNYGSCVVMDFAPESAIWEWVV